MGCPSEKRPEATTAPAPGVHVPRPPTPPEGLSQTGGDTPPTTPPPPPPGSPDEGRAGPRQGEQQHEEAAGPHGGDGGGRGEHRPVESRHWEAANAAPGHLPCFCRRGGPSPGIFRVS